MNTETAKEYIWKRIKEEGLLYPDDRTWLSPNGEQAIWTFDMKALLLDKAFLETLCEIFWSIYDREKPVQICGLEAASIPLITALVLSGKKANGLYIRKSKKKKYDLRELEGKLTNAPIVLVDDIINSGSGIEKQVKVLEKLNHDVHSVFACVRLRNPESYYYLKNAYGIEPKFIFSAEDFGADYYLKKNNITISLTEDWKFTTVAGNEFNVTRRNQMFLAPETIYLNADDGSVYALSKATGEVYWQTNIQKKVPATSNQAGIINIDDRVFALSENGTLWQLSARDGFVLSKESLLDNFYGEPVLLSQNKLLLTGREGNHYYVLIVDTLDNKVIWKKDYNFMMSVSSSHHDHDQFYIAGADGYVAAFNLNTMNLVWEINIGESIMDGVLIDNLRKRIIFVTMEGGLYVVGTRDGVVINDKKFDQPFFFAKPFLYQDKLYLNSLHRAVYRLDANSLEQDWEYETKGRGFGGVVVKNNLAFVGNNEGRLFVLKADTGKLTGSFTISDRIVSEPVLLDNNRIVIQTISNQIYSLRVSNILE